MPPEMSAIPAAGDPSAMGALPGAPGAPAAPSFKPIYSPLDSLAKILADLDFKTYIENNFGTDPDELAHKIWVMYGGPEDELGKGKEGARLDSPSSSDITQQSQEKEDEYNRTRNSRWLRLPLGVSIDQITNTQAISMAVTGGFASVAAAAKKPPAQAKFLMNLVRAAEKADQNSNFLLADKIEKYVKCTLI